MSVIPNDDKWLRRRSTDLEAARALNVTTAWLRDIDEIEKKWKQEKKTDGFDENRSDEVRERVTRRLSTLR